MFVVVVISCNTVHIKFLGAYLFFSALAHKFQNEETKLFVLSVMVSLLYFILSDLSFYPTLPTVV